MSEARLRQLNYIPLDEDGATRPYTPSTTSHIKSFFIRNKVILIPIVCIVIICIVIAASIPTRIKTPSKSSPKPTPSPTPFPTLGPTQSPTQAPTQAPTRPPSSFVECPDTPAVPEDRRLSTSTLTIATFNAEWLFLNASQCPGASSSCPWKNETTATQHLASIAAQIEKLNADIVSLEEVQDCAVLAELADMVASKKYRPYLIAGLDTTTGQNVGILTRIDPIVSLQRIESKIEYPVPGSTCNTSSGSQGVSKHYYTTFNVSGLSKPLTLIGAHLLAFPDDKNRCGQREAQASVLSSIAEAKLRLDHHVVVLGDLNDFDELSLDKANNMPISQVLSILRNPIVDIAGDELTNAASLIPHDSRYTYNNCSTASTSLDHVLFSNSLTSLVTNVSIDHSYGVTCGPTNFFSDHWPVMLTINTA